MKECNKNVFVIIHARDKKKELRNMVLIYFGGENGGHDKIRTFEHLGRDWARVDTNSMVW
jgi:hypothetical protein